MKKNLLQKLFLTSILFMIILTIYTIPSFSHLKVLRTNLEIQKPFPGLSQKIYLFNKENLLVRTEIFLEEKEDFEKIEDIIEYLKENEKESSLKGYLPKNIQLLEKRQNEDTLILNFSKEWEEVEKEDEKVAGFLYSMLELDEIQKVKILIEGNLSRKYPNALDKTFGMNKEYQVNSREDIQKVFLYYYDKEGYLLPITRYVNDNREKIEVMIEELKTGSNHEISYLKDKTKLLGYKEEKNVFYLNFDSHLYEKSKEIEEKVIATISESIFQNYDVNMVILEIEGELYQTYSK